MDKKSFDRLRKSLRIYRDYVERGTRIYIFWTSLGEVGQQVCQIFGYFQYSSWVLLASPRFEVAGGHMLCHLTWLRERNECAPLCNPICRSESIGVGLGRVFYILWVPIYGPRFPSIRHKYTCAGYHRYNSLVQFLGTISRYLEE